MSIFKAELGDKIIITEDGSHQGIEYKKGEIWIVCDHGQQYICASKDGSKLILSRNYVLLNENEYELYSPNITEPVDMPELERTIREEIPVPGPSVKEQTAQQILEEHEIGIRFASRGCVVHIGCKRIAFTTVQEAIDAIASYVNDPKTVGEYWRGQFNM